MKIEIEWIEDSIDCETCGMSGATGAVVKIDGVADPIDMSPCAACYDGTSYDEIEVYEVIFAALHKRLPKNGNYKAALEALGYEVVESHTYPDYPDYEYGDDD